MEDRNEEIRCAGCWSFMDKTDIFCRKCGVKRNDDDSDAEMFEASENEMQEIYGPPEAFERRAQAAFDPPAFDPEQNIMAPIYGPPPFMGESDDEEW